MIKFLRKQLLSVLLLTAILVLGLTAAAFATELTPLQKLDADLAALKISYNGIDYDGSQPLTAAANLQLPQSVPNFSALSWSAVGAGALLDGGKVVLTRPAAGTESLTLTARLSVWNEDSPGNWQEHVKTKIFTVQVAAYADTAAIAADLAKVDSWLAQYSTAATPLALPLYLSPDPLTVLAKLTAREPNVAIGGVTFSGGTLHDADPADGVAYYADLQINLAGQTAILKQDFHFMTIAQLPQLLANIAAHYSTTQATNISAWQVLCVESYRDFQPATAPALNAIARQNYINNAIDVVTKAAKPSDVQALSMAIVALQAMEINPQNLYTVNKTQVSALTKLNALTADVSKLGLNDALWALFAYQQSPTLYSLPPAQQTALLNKALAGQKHPDSQGTANCLWDDGYNYASYDNTGFALAALSAFSAQPQVQAAIDAAVGALSRDQQASGAWQFFGADSANSTAMVLMGLAAVGIDGEKDARFVKGANNAFTALLAMSAPQNDGFATAVGGSWNDLATTQGLLGMVAWQTGQKTAPFAPCNGLIFSRNTNLQQGIATATGNTGDENEGGYNPPPVNTPISVAFELADGEYAFSTTVEVNDKATVKDVFQKAMVGRAYTIKGGQYVSKIGKLEEFGDGPLSGWMYRVNGIHPDIGFNGYTVRAGDQISFHYTYDFTKEQGSERWSSDGYKNILSVSAGGSVTPSDLKDLIGKDVTFTFTAEAGYHLDEVLVDGKSQGKILSYTYKNLQPSARLTVNFKRNTVQFSDVPATHWVAGYLSYLTEKGIVSGKTPTLFAPNEQVTRAEFVQMLARMAGVKLTAPTTAIFSDVAVDVWYAPAIAWAVQVGIAQGENGKFYPNAPISREEMSTMLLRYTKNVAHYTLPQTHSEQAFADNAAVAVWARDGVKSLQQAGIIGGKENNLFAPQASATRAESAKMLAILLQQIEAQPQSK